MKNALVTLGFNFLNDWHSNIAQYFLCALIKNGKNKIINET